MHKQDKEYHSINFPSLPSKCWITRRYDEAWEQYQKSAKTCLANQLSTEENEATVFNNIVCARYNIDTEDEILLI